MEGFLVIVNLFKSLTVVAKLFILDIFKALAKPLVRTQNRLVTAILVNIPSKQIRKNSENCFLEFLEQLFAWSTTKRFILTLTVAAQRQLMVENAEIPRNDFIFENCTRWDVDSFSKIRNDDHSTLIRYKL